MVERGLASYKMEGEFGVFSRADQVIHVKTGFGSLSETIEGSRCWRALCNCTCLLWHSLGFNFRHANKSQKFT